MSQYFLEFSTDINIPRFLARLTNSLYGSSILEKTEVDNWLTFSLGPLTCPGETDKSLSHLDSVLQPSTFLVGDSVTIADYEVYGKLANMPAWLWLESNKKTPTNLQRWFTMMSSRPEVKTMMKALPEEVRAKSKENAIYTSECRGSDETGEGTDENPFQTVVKAIKHAGKEPFPTIYVDVKPDSEAAKLGAKYEVIAKAQLKKKTKWWKRDMEKEAKKGAVAKKGAAKTIQPGSHRLHDNDYDYDLTGVTYLEFLQERYKEEERRRLGRRPNDLNIPMCELLLSRAIYESLMAAAEDNLKEMQENLSLEFYAVGAYHPLHRAVKIPTNPKNSPTLN